MLHPVLQEYLGRGAGKHFFLEKRYNNFVSYIIVGVNNKINFTARKNDIKFKMYDFAPEIVIVLLAVVTTSFHLTKCLL